MDHSSYGLTSSPVHQGPSCVKTVKPVCFYSSQIWGCLNIPQNNTYDDIIKLFSRRKHIEKVNISLCKWLLGVHKYSSNFGVLGESGRYPIFLDISQGAVKYWQNLQRKRTEKSLLHDCVCEAEVIDAMGSISWISWMELICNELNNKNWKYNSTHEIKSKIRKPFWNILARYDQ